MNINYKDISFHQLLIKRYLIYSLNELDVMVLFISDELIKEGVKYISLDLILPYLSKEVDKKDVDSSLAKLFKKSIIKIITENNESYCSIEEFKKTLFLDSMKDYSLKEMSIKVNSDNNFYVDVEKLFKRSLNVIERDQISTFLKEGYLEDDILSAIKKVSSRSLKVSVKEVEKVLKSDNEDKDEKKVENELPYVDWTKNA